MELIDKSAVVAGIEGKINKYTKRGEESDAKRDGYGMYWSGVLSCLNEVRSFLDTLEVKEVDLEQEIQQHINDCLDIKFPTTDIKMIAKDVEYTARKFFELGLKAQKGE